MPLNYYQQSRCDINEDVQIQCEIFKSITTRTDISPFTLFPFSRPVLRPIKLCSYFHEAGTKVTFFLTFFFKHTCVCTPYSKTEIVFRFSTRRDFIPFRIYSLFRKTATFGCEMLHAKYGKYSPTKFASFVYVCITRGESFCQKNGNFFRTYNTIFSVFHNISSPNLAFLLILKCSF